MSRPAWEPRCLAAAPAQQPQTASSAVLVPLLKGEHGWSVLLEVRSAKVRQAGEICLPGGRTEPGETPVQTALRETREELGLPESAFTVLGALPPERLRFADRTVQPIVAAAPESVLQNLCIAESEVAESFLLPLDRLMETEPQHFAFSDELPRILKRYLDAYSGRNSGQTLYWEWGQHGIWGLTARILQQLRLAIQQQTMEEIKMEKTLKEVMRPYYLEQNYNCAESVLRGANEFYQLGLHDRDMILVGGYGRGIQVEGTCGALLGAVAALSMKYVEAKAHESKDIGAVAQLFDKKWKEALGTVVCGDIRKEHFNPTTRCLYTVELACDVLEATIAEYEANR